MSKLLLKDILAAIDLNAKNVWNEFSEEEKKQVGFYLLNRYASAVRGSKMDKELAILKTNEYYNKNFFNLQKHKKLLWYLLCMTANDKKQIRSHEWIGYKLKDAATQNKAVKFLTALYPNMKEDEIEMLAKINSKNELKELAVAHGMDSETIKKNL